MSTTRKQIRAAVAQLLQGISGVGSRVFESRSRQVWPEELPAILVYTRTETAEIFNESPREYKRTLQLAVEVIAKGDENVDDTLDDLCQEIEHRIFQDDTLDNLVSDTILSDTEIDFVPDGEQPVGAARITFNVEYFTLAPEEQEGLDDFLRAHIETTPVPSTEDTEPAVDDVDLPQ